MRSKINAVLAAVPLLCLGTVGADAAQAKPTSAPCTGVNASPNHFNSASIDAATLCLIDQERAAHGLRPLQVNSELHALASSQVRHMLSWDYFTDDRPPGLTPMALIASTRYPSHAKSLSIGQNIGWGTGEYSTPASMVAAWMASPPHRQIILTGEYTEAGVGVMPAVPSVLEQGHSGATYAIEFGARRF